GSNLCAPLPGPLLVFVAKANARDHDLVVDELANRLGIFERFFVGVDATLHSIILAQHVAQAANPQFPGTLERVILAARGPQWRMRLLEGVGDDLPLWYV